MALDYKTYEDAKKNFKWSERWTLFEGNKDKFNIAHECIDRHPKEETALRIKFDDGNQEMYSFGELSDLTCRFANYLETLGIGKGDKVAVLLFPRIEFYVTMFGVYRRGALLIPCFPLFGPDAISFRLEKGEAKAIVTTKDMVEHIDPELTKKLGLKIILAEDLLENLKGESNQYEWDTDANTLCMMQFSSGTTGAPKTVMYRHGAITVSSIVMKYANGLTENDTYFCPSSPGWGHGIWYGTLAPLMFGKAVGTLSGKFIPEKCFEALSDWGVTNMAAIGSHYRLLMESGLSDNYNLKLKTVVYSGEAMTRDMIETIKEKWGFYPHCQYGTTEAGPIALDFAGFEDYKIKPGSLGKPMIAGAKVAILDDNDQELPPGEIGQVAVLRGDTWIKIGDSAYKDEDGYFFYVSRLDDVIISAGYTIGPIEVEGAVMKHPSVEECAVVGSPDKDRGDLVKAFVVLNEGVEPSEALAEEIQQAVRTKLSKHEYPKEIEFVDELPKTPDGKIKRKVLKAMEVEKKSAN
jgi:acetyl-CoA synthetase